MWWAETGLHTWKSPEFSTSSNSALTIPILCQQKACGKHGYQHVTDLRWVQLQRLNKLRLTQNHPLPLRLGVAPKGNTLHAGELLYPGHSVRHNGRGVEVCAAGQSMQDPAT